MASTVSPESAFPYPARRTSISRASPERRMTVSVTIDPTVLKPETPVRPHAKSRPSLTNAR